MKWRGVGILTPTIVKYVDKARKSKDIYTAGQIARAVNIAFVEHPEAYLSGMIPPLYFTK